MQACVDNVGALRDMLSRCRLCPRCCRANRLEGQVGWCRIGVLPRVASAGAHWGEEPVLVGDGGSGTIFFSGCNLDCVFCQNYDISHYCAGEPASASHLAGIMLKLQRQGCVNINFVTPTHVAHAVAEAIVLARRQGCTIPMVYNCGGYESVPTLRLLQGLIDIYMPDFKWADAETGLKYSGVKNYPQVARAALREMYRQVGRLRVDDRGVAQKGVLVRHLVMPNDLARSRQVIQIVAATAPGCAINVMGQYRPEYRACEYAELAGRVDHGHVAELRRYAASLGLLNVDQ